MGRVFKFDLKQGIGAPSTAVVEVGDKVKRGQVLGEADLEKLSVPVHASVNGVVTEVTEAHVCVEQTDDEKEYVKIDQSGSISDIVRRAGIIGMGGAGFPFGAKVNGAIGKGVDSVIANGAECEPYLTTDHRLMRDFPEEIIQGVRLAMDAIEAEAGYIGIEDNKPDAIEVMDKALNGNNAVQVASLVTKYPQGDSARMIDSILDRQVPIGGRSGAVNAFVSNVGTFKAFYDAVYEGKPSYERVISVTGGGVKEPKNLMVKVGTPVRDLINNAGGFNGKVGAIISGGPMSGNQLYDLDSPVTKAVTGITVLSEEEIDLRQETPCIKCGKCVAACPIKLNPALIDAAVHKEKFEMAKELFAEECIQCGACSYVCPSKRHLAETIKLANEIIWVKSL